MKPDLIVFDFDGTLADTTAAILSTYRMAIAELGAEPRSDDECQATIGLPLKEGFRKLYPDFSEEELDRCTSTYRRIFNDNKDSLTPTLFPGVATTLARLAELGIEMSVASSRSRESLVEFCEKCGISSYFSLILGANDVTKAKPAPDAVLATLEKLNHSAAETFVVGDMPVDIAMVRDALCRTVGVTYGNSSRGQLIEAGADYIIDSFPSLLEIIGR